MPDIADDPVTRLAFSVQQNKGVYALLLGSGLSLSAGIPTGWGVTLNLIEKLARNQGVADQPDWYLWYKETYGKEPDYSDLLKKIAPKPAERQPIIQAYLSPDRNPDDPEDRTGLPTPAHQAIARLVKAGHIKVIVTTNFDRLLETALSAEGIQPTIIASADQCNGAIPLPHSACTILKLHGDVLDVRSLNTADELARYPKKIDRLLDRILDEYGLIIAGWSGVWDHALRAAILRTPSRRYSTWWTAYQGQIAPEAVALADHRQAERISINGADGFFQELEVKVDTFVQLNRPPPASVELLVARTKRYLTRPEHRIDLADLVGDEVRRLVKATNIKQFPMPVRYDQAEWRVTVARYEAACEPLACLLGCLGAWAHDSEAEVDQLARTAIAHLYYSRPDSGNGLSVYINVRSYPALLAFTAYGLGLVQARRWATLRRLMSLPLTEHRRSGTTTAVEKLFLGNWSGTQEKAWNELEGMDRRLFPFPEWLARLMERWGTRFWGLLGQGSATVIGTWELHGAYADLETCDIASLVRTIDGDTRGQNFVPMPFGNLIWNPELADHLLTEMASKTDASGSRIFDDAERMRLFAKNYKTIAGRRHFW